jgi:hypothetical protein
MFIASSRYTWYFNFDCGLLLVAVGPAGPWSALAVYLTRHLKYSGLLAL